MEARGFNQCTNQLVRVKCDFKLGLLVVLLSLINIAESNPPFGRRPGERRHLEFFEDSPPVYPFGRHRHRHRAERPMSYFDPQNEVPQTIDFPDKLEETTRTTVVILPDGIRVINEQLDSSGTDGRSFYPEVTLPTSPPLKDPSNPTGPKLQGFDIDVGDNTPPATVAPKTNQLCPTGQGFHRKTGKCYRFATIPKPSMITPTPCGKLMDFYRDPANASLGICDCGEGTSKLGARPLAYWKPTDSCYFLFDQGPCFTPNEWFILTDEGFPACSRRTCPHNSPKNYTGVISDLLEDKSAFWFRERGKCFQTRHTNYCNSGNTQVVFENSPKSGYILTCAEAAVIDTPMTRFLTNTIKDLPCKPGYSRTVNGQCGRSGSFE